MEDKIREYANNLYLQKSHRLSERRCLIYTIKDYKTFVRGFKNAIIVMCYNYICWYNDFLPFTITTRDGTIALCSNSSEKDNYIVTKNTYNMFMKPKQKIKNVAYSIKYANSKLSKSVTCRNLLKVYRQ